MRVLVHSAWGEGRAVEQLVRSAALDRFRVHSLTTDPLEADVILFAETVHFEDPTWRTVRTHPYLARYREKCFLYNEADHPWCVLPGLYCSMPRRAFQPARQKAFGYLYTMNEQVRGPSPAIERRWLYSFIGSANHESRRRILRLRDARALLEDTSTFNIWLPVEPGERERRERRYAEVMQASLFALCPRGAGTSSYRLYEAMKLGIAPVVVGDEWVAPEGPAWHTFLLRVAEAEVARLPELLRGREAEALERGKRARRAWEEHFAPEVQFHRAAEACGELLKLRRVPESVARYRPSVERARTTVHRWLHEGKMYLRARLRASRPGR
ncbi:MAG: exostosin family protein [Myxococcaceae bacterium]|nr:exostosin family protein [Myxococcaceae bacterium]